MSIGESPAEEGARQRRFRALHEQMYPDLLRFVERRIPAGDAEDVVSTVFLTAWRRLDDVSDDARPWLFAVARRTMANHTRGWLRRRALDVRLAERDEYPAADYAGATVARIDLVRALQTLSVADREVLALIAFDNLSVDQAATVVGCRRSTFGMRLSRARSRLRRAIASTDAAASATAARSAGPAAARSAGPATTGSAAARSATTGPATTGPARAAQRTGMGI